MIERTYTPKEISELSGGTMSEESIRAACRRDVEMHPLPHTRTGTRERSHYRISESAWNKWLDEEGRIQVGLA